MLSLKKLYTWNTFSAWKQSNILKEDVKYALKLVIKIKNLSCTACSRASEFTTNALW